MSKNLTPGYNESSGTPYDLWNYFPQNNRKTGDTYETRACNFLQQNGFRILERNFRIRMGEIDIIATDGPYLVFIEVKARRNLKYGRPCEAVTPRKQETIRKVSEYWLMIHGMQNAYRRYDVVEILSGNLNLIRNAF